MIINNAPVNEAVISNVASISEFRIRNSAKAFQILSSGLYENKIRAIIRELSCNAVDSHVAANNEHIPFDVHLPNTLEPWLAIRDYGTGLDDSQVVNIYTTYFESTKTDSNQFIGALGLGSKSPFSYTDNFTVTAIKNGIKGIYTAFINDQGVPSIALMASEESNEPTGVEVKFSVELHSDFQKFSNEAEYVYTYFKLRPVVTGNGYFKFKDVAYKDVDIIPGVHSNVNSNSTSFAVMGNIAYPIRIPNDEQNLGHLRNLLKCGLELHFDIGELEFQASREGLSYTPQTIQTIKSKLIALESVLLSKLSAELNAIENKWERAIALYKKRQSNLWNGPAIDYASKYKLETFDASNMYPTAFVCCENDLKLKYNIKLNSFVYSNTRRSTISLVKLKTFVDPTTGAYLYGHEIRVNDSTTFVVNDTKLGASNRAKQHWETHHTQNFETIFVIEAVDKSIPMQVDKFFESLYNPPNIVNASNLTELPKKETVARDKDCTILHLYGNKWNNVNLINNIDNLKTYYYVPISGYSLITPFNHSKTPLQLVNLFDCGISEIDAISSIYGIRKSDLPIIKQRPNWVDLETFLHDRLHNISASDKLNLIKGSISTTLLQLAANSLPYISNKNSEFVKTFEPLINAKFKAYRMDSLITLIKMYDSKFDIQSELANYKATINATIEKYPLITNIERYANPTDVAEYINLKDL